VGKTKRGKGTKIMAIAAGNSVPLAVTIDSASPHESKLVDETLAGSFLDELPEKLVWACVTIGSRQIVKTRRRRDTLRFAMQTLLKGGLQVSIHPNGFQ